MEHDVFLARKSALNEMISRINSTLTRLPAGKLRVKDGDRPHYYHVTPNGRPCGDYIKASDRELAVRLAQRDYLTRVLHAAESELEAIRCFEARHLLMQPEGVFDTLKPCRRILIDPINLSDEEFARRWAAESYDGKSFAPGDPSFYSSRNERMRSKSEVLIANTLDELGIPYRYEAPLALKNGRIIHPDFTILRVRSRKVCYFEHCGRMDDSDYLHRFMKREQQYIINGFIPGRDVFMSFESATDPLNTLSLREELKALFVGQ